ncbi:MAG: AAA family ATPase, partial [Betaproteobacteria bacterium]
LINYVKTRGIKLLCLDPAVYTHQLVENDVADMAEYMRILTQIAKHGGCAVVVLHHMNKGGANSSLDDVTSGSLRGASSFSDNARSVMTVVSMPIHDAPTYGLPSDHDTVSRYLVAKHTKHNYSGSMGIQVFERKGALLIPRNDVIRLSAEEAQEARDAQKREAAQRRMLMLVPRALEVLLEAGDAVSQNFVAHEMNAKPATVKEVLQWCVDQDYVEMSEGPNRSRLHELNKNGRVYLKLLKKEAKNAV